jgi:hypothetical protein
MHTQALTPQSVRRVEYQGQRLSTAEVTVPLDAWALVLQRLDTDSLQAFAQIGEKIQEFADQGFYLSHETRVGLQLWLEGLSDERRNQYRRAVTVALAALEPYAPKS